MSAASPIRRHDAQGRDRALERVRATTRWVFAAAVAATGIVIGLAAHFYPGHNSTAGASVTQSGTSASGGSGTSGGTSSAPAHPSGGYSHRGRGFSSPSVAPSQAPSPGTVAPLPQVRTGGS